LLRVLGPVPVAVLRAEGGTLAVLLLGSMLDLKPKANDHPSDCAGQIKSWLKHGH
jgi:hypothetical protein